MKVAHIIPSFLLLFTLHQPASASAFCAGYEAGYVAGYCYERFSCLEPLTPLCPLADLGQDNFEGGYQRGFLEGLARQPNY